MSFCAAPFITMYAWPNGDVAPCCVIQNAGIGNINDTPMDELINHPVLRDMRQKMLDNKPCDLCNKCYIEEAATGHSTRKYFNDLDVMDGVEMNLSDTIDDFKMYYWDVRFSNLCNFKCRMCGPLSSTKWYEDQDILDENFKGTLTSINDVDEFFDKNFHNLKHVKKIYFAGGEPLIQPEHYRFLDKLIEYDITDISIYYQTNGSFFDYGKHDLFWYLDHFRHVQMSVSLDGSKDVTEYIRTGINWRKTMRNLRKYSEKRSNLELSINCSISAYNVLDVTSFFDAIHSNGLVHPNNIFFNQVTFPDYLQPSVLPEEIKQKARDQILSSKWQKQYPAKFKMVTDLLDINNEERFPAFKEYTKKLDARRNTDVTTIMPELFRYWYEKDNMVETHIQKFNVYYNDDFVYIGMPHQRTLEDYFLQYTGAEQLEMEIDASIHDFNTPLSVLTEMGFDLKNRPVITAVENPFSLLPKLHNDSELRFEEWMQQNYTDGSDRVYSRCVDDADYPIRMDHLAFDLKNTCHRIGIEYFENFKVETMSLPRHYSRYFNDNTVEMVNDYFNAILIPFNFKMEFPDTLCSTAEASLRTLTDASCQICCMNTRRLSKDDGTPFSIETDTIDEIWNSNSRKEVIDDLRNGIQHPSCQKCWNEEAAGLESRRVRDNKYNGVAPDKNFSHPTMYEFNLGTVCNIKCRTCGPWASSKWLDEYFSTGLDKLDRPDATNLKKFREVIEGYSKFYRDDSKFWDEVRGHLSEVRHIDFYGGEPFLVKNQWKLLDYAIKNDFAKDITIHYNTNGTLWDQKKVKILDEFKKVKIDFSIDGINDRLEYIRHPAKWKKVEKHLLEAVSLYHDDVAICHTVSVLNMYYVDEMLQWAHDNNVQIYLNLVHGPEWYNIKNIPESVKAEITKKLTNNVNDKMSGWFSLSGVIDFMNSSQADPKVWDRFKLITASVDHNRNESFKTIFPEYYEIIKENGEW